MMEALPLMVLLLLFAISNIELVGGDPKPQHLERTRVVGLKNYSKNHRRHEKAGGSNGERKPNPDNNQVEDASDENFKLWDDGPNFDTNLQQNVVSLVDRTAYLTCRVFDRGNKTVSWIRHHDLHILTVGSYTYTADLRFRSIYNSRKDEWVLQIQYVQKRDAGRYECQINTQPVRSYFVQLQVVGEIPVASILGNPQVFIESGSVLNLTCVVKQAITKPAFIIWRHGTKTIDYSSPRGGISVETNTSGNTPTSYLLIDAVAPSDSGKYSCHPANAQEISVNVQVQEGEHQAAIHTNKASRQSAGGLVLLLPTMSTMILPLLLRRRLLSMQEFQRQ